MKIVLLRLAFILTIVFIESSFFDILLPRLSAPIVLIASVVAWILLSGFPRALIMTVPLALFFDIVSTGAPGAFSLYAVLLAYSTSFLSRRLLVEHRGLGMGLYALFVGIATFGYSLFDLLFFRSEAYLGIPELFSNPFSIFSVAQITFPIILCLPLFIAVYSVIRRFEGYAGFLAQRDLSNVK